MVNLLKKTAQHGVDPGPTFNCHLPIFPDVDKDLEFGFEQEYFKAKGSTPREGGVLQGKPTNLYKVVVGNAILALFTYGTPEHPMAVSRVFGNNFEIFWFRGWGDLPFDPNYFQGRWALRFWIRISNGCRCPSRCSTRPTHCD
jgi:hypothetical protein